MYQDEHLVAIDKPPGLLVHRSGLDAGETRFADQLLAAQLGRPVWLAHRLDKGTSGLLLFALHADAARQLGTLFERGQVQRRYLAVVRGWPPAQGRIDHPLRRLADDQRSARGLSSQPACTRFETQAQGRLPIADRTFAQTRFALLALQPETGRRHQLRRHCKHMAHPIIGDTTHGKGPLNRAVAQWLGLQRLWLHAQVLELPHPASGQSLRLLAPPGPAWQLWGRAGCAPDSPHAQSG